MFRKSRSLYFLMQSALIALRREVETSGMIINYSRASGLMCVLVLAGAGISSCASHDNQVDMVKSKPVAAPSERPADRRKSNVEDRQETFGDAVMAPLEDLNLRRQEIPEILQYALRHTYDLKGLDSCEAITAEVERLNEVLGDDFDEPPPPEDDSTLTQKGGRAAKKGAMGAVRGAARGIIPFRGVVRQMTGADRHEKEMLRAIKAGGERRSYLKGIGMNRNCAPPAAPSWFVPKEVNPNDNR